jgi:exodeoxyribonuclease VIII
MQSISHNEYLKIDAVSRSDLLAIKKSIKYYLHVKANGVEETESLKFGRMLHKFILEHDSFENDYFILKEKIKRTTKEGKALYESVLIEAGSREVVTMEEYQKLTAMRDVLFSNELVTDKKLLENIEAEKTFIADMPSPTNNKQGVIVKCKVRPDLIKRTEKSLIMADLKSCCSLENFNDEIFKRNYHVQAAFYLDIYSLATGETPKTFLFIAIEKEPPYLNKIFRVDNDSEIIELGRSEYIRLLVKYEIAKENNFIENDIVSIVEIPSWYKFKINN